MTDPILVDTGPICAIFDNNDEHHALCKATLDELTGPLHTTWPVITEAAWLLKHKPAAIQILLGLISRGAINVHDLPHSAAGWIAEFMRKYHDLPAQLADASLIYLADRHHISQVFTLDRRDFSVFRLRDNRPLTLLPQL